MYREEYTHLSRILARVRPVWTYACADGAKDWTPVAVTTALVEAGG
jgi:hypothetical protein